MMSVHALQRPLSEARFTRLSLMVVMRNDRIDELEQDFICCFDTTSLLVWNGADQEDR
jgi:hypothetical protein